MGSRSKKRPKVSSFSLRKLLGKAIPFSLDVELVTAEAMTLVISLLAFAGFAGFMLLAIFVSFFLVAGAGFFPIALFVAVLGLALGVLGLMGINTFIAGVQYHLAMQKVTNKPLDFGLAWRLSAARFRDAFVVQGSLFATLFIAGFLALIPSVFLLDSPNLVAAFASPESLLVHAPLTVLMLAILFLFLEPFLFLALPVAYFEDDSPMGVLERVKRYIFPHYMGVLGVVIVLFGITSLTSTLANMITNFPLAQNVVRGTAFVFVLASGVGFLVQIAAILFAFTLNVVTQTLLYLHMGNPAAQNYFSSTHPVAKLLARMVPAHRHYSPIRWKSPGDAVLMKKRPKSR